MTDKSGKRNRSGNFDQDDVELFLSLVNESKTLIESNKQEDKKKVNISAMKIPPFLIRSLIHD